MSKAVGISAVGVHLPRTRMAAGKAERVVAGPDEDSITLAVNAAADCLRNVDRATVGGLFFASTTQPYQEKQAAALIARALDLPRNLMTADHGGSLRAGISALTAAVDAVRAGSANSILVVASDCRMAPPRSAMESSLGDAAVAFLVADDAALVLENSHFIADEIVDVWRAEGDAFVHAWEDRFVVDKGYRPVVSEAVQGLCKKMGHSPADFDRIALYAPDLKSHTSLVKSLRVPAERVVDPLFGKVGNTGVSFAPLLLARAIAQGKPNERLLCAAYGDGATAMAWRRTDRACAVSLDRQLSLGRRLDPEVYRRARHLDRQEPSLSSGTSATKHWRERDDEVTLLAQVCRKCRTKQFPAQRVCFHCHTRDEFDRVRLSDRPGKVLSYTFDYFHPSAETPTIAGIVEVDGCRLYLMMTDAKPEELKCDLPVELTFRRIHESGGRPNYFWKSTPTRSANPS